MIAIYTRDLRPPFEARRHIYADYATAKSGADDFAASDTVEVRAVLDLDAPPPPRGACDSCGRRKTVDGCDHCVPTRRP